MYCAYSEAANQILTPAVFDAREGGLYRISLTYKDTDNAGKSSAINKITGVHKLAKTSKTPGRTQTLNFFSITDDWRLVDLPGYGYANVSKALKVEWDKVLSQYLQSRRQTQRGAEYDSDDTGRY